MPILLASIILILIGLAAAIAFGGPKTPPPMASISNSFRGVDFSDLPPLSRFPAADGTELAYRHYPPARPSERGSVVLLHGSSANSKSMHLLAKGFAGADYAAFALDVRGHGDSGPKGTIAYVGQLEDDLESFLKGVTPGRPATLVGFSGGGGFALRFAGSARQEMFDGYLLLSPFLGEKAPTARPDHGGWVKVGVPRLWAVAALNALGIRFFNHLPVIGFAMSEEAKNYLTPHYDFPLAANYGPRRDLAANIRAARQPCAIVAGTGDEAFRSEEYEAVFRKSGKDWPVILLPGIGHIALTLDPTAITAVIAAVDGMAKRQDGPGRR